jgi:hypothetical protein
MSEIASTVELKKYLVSIREATEKINKLAIQKMNSDIANGPTAVTSSEGKEAIIRLNHSSHDIYSTIRKQNAGA